ncbi:MAG TPA: SDR family NAD(P)-dependent oxidoreductase [Candidatus Hydrogenedentes bacterium]|nr:SDR family NAD(P)-dependent oxidoreductase [Candidatus Hydrogenedentota bacterium]
MQVDLTNRIAIVTGAAQGIGRSIAQALTQNGATVMLSDIQEEKGRATAEELGPNADFFTCDVSDAEQVRELFDTVIERHGRLDIAVNNAGINTGPENRVTIDQYPDEIWHRIINVDLNGTFYCCKAAAAQMIKQHSGSIINIASIAGVVPLRLQIGFVAAKAGVIKLTEAMAAELGPMGIRVNTVSPGSTLVEGTKQLFYNNKELAEKLASFIPMRRPGETNEIAEAVLFLASDAASYVNGHNLVVDGGWVCGFSRDF